jgi:hypothetical protein
MDPTKPMKFSTMALKTNDGIRSIKYIERKNGPVETDFTV